MDTEGLPHVLLQESYWRKLPELSLVSLEALTELVAKKLQLEKLLKSSNPSTFSSASKFCTHRAFSFSLHSLFSTYSLTLICTHTCTRTSTLAAVAPIGSTGTKLQLWGIRLQLATERKATDWAPSIALQLVSRKNAETRRVGTTLIAIGNTCGYRLSP